MFKSNQEEILYFNAHDEIASYMIQSFYILRFHSCNRDAWKSTVYSVKTVSTDFSGNIHRKCTIFFPELHLPNGMTTSPHPDHSTGPKPIQLVQVVFTIE